MSPPQDNPPQDSPLQDSARCVQCGLCLPHCPTYRVSQNEAESPRGRLMLMHALNTGRLRTTPSLAAHLDHCLHCGACEAICPAKVPYARLINAAKSRLRADDGRTLPYWLRALTASRPVRVAAAWWLTGLDRIGVLRSRLARRIAAALTPNASPDFAPALQFKHCLPLPRARDAHDANGAPALFVGCVAQIADRETLHAAAQLLQAAGCPASVPTKQTCCGALHAHHGDAQTAQRFIARNDAAFAHAEAVVSCASGCGAFLRTLKRPVLDFADYLETQLSKDDNTRRLDFAPLPKRVAVHTPCTLRHGPNHDQTIALLQRIPDIQLTPPPTPPPTPSSGKNLCCGAAGANMLEQPDTADELGRAALAQAADADLLVTSNVGCAMHFRRIIKTQGKDLPVIHPATLLWKQLVKHRNSTSRSTS